MDLDRRTLLLGLTGAAAATFSACGQGEGAGSATRTQKATPTMAPGTRPKVLVAYFSRPGENYFYGDRTWLEVGNTEVVAQMIPDLIDCDLHKIEAADPYPEKYDACVDRNRREQDEDARPAIANPPPDLDQYDVVLLGGPIWNVRAPMIMATFTEGLDFSGKTVHPFATHAMSGLGRTEADYATSCPGATLNEGLAIQGERAKEARPDLRRWLRRIGLAVRG